MNDPNPCPGASSCFRCLHARKHPGAPDCRGNALCSPVPWAHPTVDEHDEEWMQEYADRLGISVDEVFERAEQTARGIEHASRWFGAYRTAARLAMRAVGCGMKEAA